MQKYTVKARSINVVPAIKVQQYAVGTTYFMNYNFEYNPWRIWNKHIQNTIQNDLKRLEIKEKENSNNFHNEKYIYKRIHNHMCGALLVTIYSEMENCLKRILNIEKYEHKCFQYKIKQANINLQDLIFYKEINILRLQVNAFKHNNMIMTKELAKELKTKDLKLIDYTQININELINQCCGFLFDLEEKIKKENQ